MQADPNIHINKKKNKSVGYVFEQLFQSTVPCVYALAFLLIIIILMKLQECEFILAF
jgi:hypothetical protein